LRLHKNACRPLQKESGGRGRGSGMYVGKPKKICHLEDLGIDEKTIDLLID